MANWIAGHTDRFRTIVSHDGMFDLITGWFSGDLFLGGVGAEFNGAPWQDQNAWLENAPVTFARGFRSPMLIIHSERDYRVDSSQGFAMFQILQAMHIPSTLLYFKEENHWVQKPADSIFWYHTVPRLDRQVGEARGPRVRENAKERLSV